MINILKIRFVSLVLLILVSLSLAQVSVVPVFAADYQVTATVPFNPPAQPAVIDPALNGKTVDTALTLINGICEHVAPATIVSIWRDGTSIGSVNCELSGTFQLSVSLKVGSNTIIARSSSLSNDYGPDSSPVTINYTPPLVTPSPPTTPRPSTSTPTSTDTVASDLTIGTPTPFVIMDEENAAAIQVIIKGGKGPYTVTINWGDGTTESSVVADLGTFSFKHQYADNGIYKVVATVTDVLGASEVYQFVVSALSLPSSESERPANTTQPNDNGNTILYVVIGLIFVLFLILLLASTFWLGRRYEYRALKDVIIKQPSQRFLLTKKKKARK